MYTIEYGICVSVLKWDWCGSYLPQGYTIEYSDCCHAKGNLGKEFSDKHSLVSSGPPAITVFCERRLLQKPKGAWE